MPPACTPEKVGGRNYPNSDQELNREYGYITPPRNSPNENKTSERENKHMQWLLRKLPRLSNYFKLHRQIGEGTFSAVFLASLRNDFDQTKLFAVKHLIPTTHPVRIEVELRCLKLIGGKDNVAGVDLCIRENENIVFIMPYLEHMPFVEYFSDIDAKETALYIKNLLKAVRRVHSFGIIHRDIKPNNFLYDRETKKFLLVDFGLAQVCSANSPLATIKPANAINSQKRKREEEISSAKTKDDLIEPVIKRPALQKRNLNALNTTVSHLQNTISKKPAALSLAKENVLNVSQKIKKSPFKSPLKNICKPVLKSPYKFTGLDLPPTHSLLAQKMPGQRRLFDDNEDLKKFKNQTFVSSVSIMSQRHMSALQNKSKQTQNSLLQDCKCFNKASVCTVCLVRKAQEAPRAGTPGFRPPEVLLKCNKQTTAVDMWAVGVILLSILSRTYPFFRAPDDVTALAEMITLFGDEQIKKISKLFGRHLMCSEKKPPLDLRKVCCRLRDRGKLLQDATEKKCPNCFQFIQNCLCIGTPMDVTDDIFPDSAYDLLQRLLDIDPYTRISAEEALLHPYLKDILE